jgi:hypothetical protein
MLHYNLSRKAATSSFHPHPCSATTSYPMGNFVSFAPSYPVPTYLPRRRADTTTHVPQSSPPPTSSKRSSLTSSLASLPRRLVKRLRRFTSGRTRVADVERGLPPDSNGALGVAAAAAAPVAQVTAPSARRRALLIGIAYRGELLNTHQDVDRYRGVLIGMFTHRSLAAARSLTELTCVGSRSRVRISARGHHRAQGRPCVPRPSPADAREHCQSLFPPRCAPLLDD